MSVELMPCPFCGGDADYERHGTNRQSCIVSCENCGAILESNEIGRGVRWNHRTPDPRLEVAREALESIAKRGEGSGKDADLAEEALAKIKGC